MKIRTVIILALLAALAAAIVKYRLASQQEQVMEGICESNGRTELKRLDIASVYGGRVEEMLVDEGDYISRGQVVARLKSTQISQQVQAARAGLDAAVKAKEAALKRRASSEAEISVVREKIRLAGLELENARKLRRDGLVGQTELERHVSALRQLNSSLAGAISALEQLEAEAARADALIRQAQAELARLEDALSDMTVTSPVSGFVEYTLTDPGSVIPSGGRIASVLDPLDLSLDLFLPSAVASGLKTGDEGRILFEGSGYVLPAKISFIASEAQFSPKFVETRAEREKLLFKVTLKADPGVLSRCRGCFSGGMPALGYVRCRQGAAWPETLSPRLPESESQEGKAPAGSPQNGDERACFRNAAGGNPLTADETGAAGR